MKDAETGGSVLRASIKWKTEVLQVNGISVHVEDHGSGKPVLLLHGWPDFAYLWRNQIPFLANNGFHAIAPDLRGFGRSDRPRGVGTFWPRTRCALSRLDAATGYTSEARKLDRAWQPSTSAVAPLLDGSSVVQQR
jgi:pimeloyl-ACP methyl ester carboxylesterase